MTNGRKIFLYLHNKPWEDRPWYHKAWRWIFFNTPTKKKHDDDGQIKVHDAAVAQAEVENKGNDGDKEIDQGAHVFLSLLLSN